MVHLNISKCKILRITRKFTRIEYPYQLEDTILENTVWTWPEHGRLETWLGPCIKQVLQPTKKLLGYIRRSSKNIKVHMKWKLSLSYLKELLKWWRNSIYSFPISLFVLEILRFVWYVNNTLHTSHCIMVVEKPCIWLKLFC